MKACDTLFKFKTLLETALNLDDVKLRGLISSLVSDMNTAFKLVIYLEDNDNEKKEVNYII
ncbi:hypothetical protein LCGC14_1135710 [marine sediment metagenome]|uniref:Uncharacterized protein n=1 Tax=marine sediment metagenome TaxID=412755 RepID=A0A0F9Q5G8_9ZZZZ